MEKNKMGEEANIVESSGLFDRGWYVATYPETREVSDPILHFFDNWHKRYKPNPYFDPVWYFGTYGAELLASENPLLHYIRRGESENAWPSPHFDPEWYRDEYEIAERESPLRHYLANRGAGTHSPLPIFDAPAYVLDQPECLASGNDPYLHWLAGPRDDANSGDVSEPPLATILRLTGGNMDTDTYPDSVPWQTFKAALRLLVRFIPFDEDWYCAQYPDVNEALRSGSLPSAHEHFIDDGFFEGRHSGPIGIRE